MGLELSLKIELRDRRSEEEEGECRTPRSEDHLLKPLLVCPPAPKKPRMSLKRKSEAARVTFFFAVPRDLSKVFVALPNLSKKIKVG
ncbi:hypothetical protein QJS04_geneDACA004068 [Acorus gramineus]|uniref:Uncharacterized protein n=1 Tax=Acorus gramineus TaxID=55184 RepID=A0AAV9BKX7_ACOGR|nr:hypothetical protein QJS04_geneDACA004068 [Acorus gramineus]